MGTIIEATKMIIAMPGMPLFINEATPENMVSSNRFPLVNKIEMGITFAGIMAMDADIK